MKLYEIEKEIREVLEQVDEDGVLQEGAFERFQELKVAEAVKIENTALFYKELIAEAKAIKAEEQLLQARRKAKENHAINLKNYIDLNLAGAKFETSRVVLSYRKSVAVNILDETAIPMNFREKQPDKILKAEISEALKSGKEVSGAVLVENQNLQIK